MSNAQFAFLQRSNAPSHEALQASIHRLGFDLTVDPEFTLYEDEGMRPCIFYGDANVGFEVFYESVSDIVDDFPDLQEIVGDTDFCISMVWHFSTKDAASVAIVSCALAKDFGVVISYEGEKSEPYESLLETTKHFIEKAEREG